MLSSSAASPSGSAIRIVAISSSDVGSTRTTPEETLTQRLSNA